MVYMSKTKRKRVRRQRILGLLIAAACIAAAIVVIWQVGLGSTLVKVEDVSIRSGMVKGVSSFLEYSQTGYFPDNSTAGMTKEEKAEEEDQALVDRNSLVDYLFIPLEVLKLHFKDIGTDFPDEETLATINETPDYIFSDNTTASLFRENKVKKKHVAYYYEYGAAMDLYWDEVMENDPITDEQAQECYDEYKDYYFTTPFSMQASHILLQDPDHTPERLAEIEGILDRLKDGEDFAELAMEYSEDGSAESGGDLGSFGLGQMVAPFEEACLALEPGEISDIVETEFGYHIIKMTSKTEESITPIDEAMDTIESILGNERVTEALEALREQYTITYYGLITPSTGKPPMSLEELDEARGIEPEDEDEYDEDLYGDEEDFDWDDSDLDIDDSDIDADYEWDEDEDWSDDEGDDEYDDEWEDEYDDEDEDYVDDEGDDEYDDEYDDDEVDEADEG